LIATGGIGDFERQCWVQFWPALICFMAITKCPAVEKVKLNNVEARPDHPDSNTQDAGSALNGRMCILFCFDFTY